jgi:hypothetical protein
MALKRKRVRLSQPAEEQTTLPAPIPPVVFRPGLGDASFQEAQQQLEITDPKDFVASREFGLGMALVGLAESHMQRLPHLINILRVVEARLSTPEFLQMVATDPHLMLDVQKALSDNVDASGKAIAHVVASGDLEKLRLLRDRRMKKQDATIEMPPAQDILDAPQTEQQEVNPLALLHILHQRFNVGH